jgi:hypothetical protein
MKKEDRVANVTVIAQLLSAIKDNIEELKKARKIKDGELMAGSKMEILSFQKKLEELL